MGNYKPLAIFCSCIARLVLDLVGNPEDRFSSDRASLFLYKCLSCTVHSAIQFSVVGSPHQVTRDEITLQEPPPVSVLPDQVLLSTVKTLSFRPDRSGQTVQTQIRLLLEEQSDQGLHCLLFHLNHFDKIPSGLASLFEF